MVEVETPTDRAGEELVQNVKAHVRNVLREPLKHQNAAHREVLITQVTMAAVQACFAFLAAHDSYRNPRPVEFEDLPEVDLRADEVRIEQFGGRADEAVDLPKVKSPHTDSGVTQ